MVEISCGRQQYYFFSENGLEMGVVQRKSKMTIREISFKVNEGVYFGELFNQWRDMVA